jgi:hypothetical protein
MAKPPTLGNRLGDRMQDRGHTVVDAAGALGATPRDVERWVGDREAPGTAQLPAVADYLATDVAEVRRLVLRSQMRQVQRDIRGGDTPTRAAS